MVLLRNQEAAPNPPPKKYWRFREDIHAIFRDSRNFGIITAEVYNSNNKYANNTSGKSATYKLGWIM